MSVASTLVIIIQRFKSQYPTIYTMGIREFAKEYYRGVVLPSVLAVGAVCCSVIIPYIYGTAAGIDIPFRSDHYSSVTDVDTNGDGKLDTRITVIPRAGTLREIINSE